MRKFTFLFALFLMMVGTAMADVIKSPSTTLLTTTELNAATTDVVLAIKCISASNSYWFCGNKSVNSTTDQEIIWVWEPTGDGTTHYLKKYAPTSAQSEGYLQKNTYGIGAKETAQKFKATSPSLPTNESAVAGTNTENGYIVRFAWEDGTNNWINVQTPTGTPKYNNGNGLFTMYNVHAVNLPITDLANLSNNKAYTLRTKRSDLVAKSYGSRIATTNDIRGTFNDNDSHYQFALLKNTSGEYFLYSISASMFVNKTGDLVNSPTDPILFKDGNATGTFVLYFDADHYINMGGSKQLLINDYNTPDEGNSFTITPVADIADMVDNVTVNFIVDGKTYSSATKNFLINTAINAEKFATDLNGTYLAYASTNVETVTAETNTINVTCSVETLPFVVSASLDNATWYLIDMHSNDTGAPDITSGAKNYIWTATTDASAYTTAEVTLPKYDTKQSATFGDNMLWCFKGNVVDGFVIYNKAAGSEYALAKPETGETAVKLAAVGDATPFRIYKSSQITGAACFKKQGDDYYVNTQANESTGNVKVLRGWNDTDGGSSCRFFAPDHYLLNYAADITAGPANSLGTAQYFNAEGKFESFNSAIDAANANHFSATATANLATILTEYASDEANATTNATTITDGGYYRLMNFKYKTYMTNGTDGSYNDLKGGVSASDAAKTVGTVVKFVADESNYKLYVQDLAVGKTAISTQVNLTEEGIFTITSTNNKYGFKDVSTAVSGWENYRYLHCDGSNKIVGWEIGAEASKWYVVPAESIDVALTNVGTSNYATAYLPFAVQGSGLYTGGISADKTALTMTAQENAVPAKTGLVIKSDNPTVTLTICDSADPVSANSLIGSLTPVTENLSNYLVLGKGNTSNSIGFFAPSASLTSIAANKAYLNASDVASGEGSAIALNFGGTSTAILDVVNGTLESNAPVFDLSGRRVMKTVKGSLYIQNGKKFIAR